MLPIAAIRHFCTAIIFVFHPELAASPSSSCDADREHHQQQAPEPTQELELKLETEQSSPSPHPSHVTIGSISEAHRHQPESSQPSVSFAPSQAHSNDDQLNIRGFTLSVSPNTETLVHFHAIDIKPVGFTARDEERKTKQLRPVNLGKLFLGLIYQTMVSFLVFHYSSSASIASLRHANIISMLFDVAKVAVVVGSAVSLVGLLIREIRVEQAMILEKVGRASAALGFFLLTAMFLTEISTVISLLGGVGFFVALVFVFIKMNEKGKRVYNS